MKLRFASRQQHDLKTALLAFGQRGTTDLYLVSVRGRVLHLQWAGALDLDSIVEVGSSCQVVGTEAGARIVDLEKLNCCAGPVLNRGLDVIGVTARRDHQIGRA